MEQGSSHTAKTISWQELKVPWLAFDLQNEQTVDLNDLCIDYFPQIKKGSDRTDLNKYSVFRRLSARILSQVCEKGGTLIKTEIGSVLIFPSVQYSSKTVLLVFQDLHSSSHNKSGFANNISALYKIKLNGDILDCNYAFSEILGEKDPCSLIGKNISEYYFDPDLRVDYINEISDKGFMRNYEIIIRKSDGSLAWAIENSSIETEGKEEFISGSIIDITEDKLTRERLSLIFKESSDAIILLKGLKFIDCNEKVEEIFGYSKDELLKSTVTPLLQQITSDNPEKKEYIQLKTEKVLNGEPQKMQVVLRRKDGSQLHGEVNLIPFSVLNEHFVEIIIRDVSERVLFEKTIRESEERFKLLANVAIEGVVFVNNEEILDCNEQFVQLTGRPSRSALIGKNIGDFIDDKDLPRLRHMASLSGVNRIEVRGRKDDGQLIILESSGSIINYMDKEVMAFLFYDITSRKKTEQALEQSINRFKGLVENSPNAVFILTDGRIKYSNQSGTKLLGYKDEDDVFDLEFVTLFSSEYRKDIERNLNLVRDGEEVEYRELVIQDSRKKEVDVGIKLSLTVYDNRPSIQLTINNLSTERLLFQEKSRAQLAEEINNVLKKEIEEHKNTQNKLLQAQRFTRNIIESSLDMIIAVDRDMKVSEFNTSARIFFGYSADEILGKPIRRLFADKKSWDRVDKELMANGYFSGEVENIKKNGDVFTCFLSASLIRAQDGTILGSMGVSRDITEMKKAEQELRASEERYRDIFENVLDYILSIGLDGTILYANRSFLNNLGYTKAELAKLKIFDLCDPGQLQSDEDLTEQLSGQNLNLIIRDKVGNKLLLKGNTNIKYDGDKPLSIRAIFRNVTEVVEQRAKLESIFNSTENILMWTVDKEKKISSYNKNLKKVWENEFGKLIERKSSFLEVIEKSLNKDLYQGQLERYEKTFNGEPQQFEIPLLNKDGDNVWLQFFLNPVYYEGNLEEVSCMAYDVTDRKEIDRRILDALKEKEVLLQEVHHRVKNNLQVISSILNLQSSYVDDTETLEVLKESQNRIKSMSYIHETLYQTSDFGSIEFSDYISVIVRNLIHSYITDSPVNYTPKLDRLCLGLDQAIPCGLIINELVSNAMKYAFEKVDNPELIVEFCEDKGHLKIRVKDNGIGLPKDFAYEDSNSLGIQLVYSLVEQLDGELEINADSGTEFIIRFEKIV